GAPAALVSVCGGGGIRPGAPTPPPRKGNKRAQMGLHGRRGEQVPPDHRAPPPRFQGALEKGDGEEGQRLREKTGEQAVPVGEIERQRQPEQQEPIRTLKSAKQGELRKRK